MSLFGYQAAGATVQGASKETEPPWPQEDAVPADSATRLRETPRTEERERDVSLVDSYPASF
jgi:hypothetical protein